MVSQEKTAPALPTGFETVDAPTVERPFPSLRLPRLTGRRADVLAATAALALGVWVTIRLWLHVHSRVIGPNPGDHTFFEWMLAYGAHVVAHGGNPFHTGLINVPDGVSVAANTNVLGLSIPLAPVTLAFGPDVSFVLLLTLALALTAFGWYLVFSRYLVADRLGAMLGGLFCGFAPALVAHGNGQPNQVAQFVIPYLVLVALRLDRRPVRNGIVLGLLTTYQAFVNEEHLFITAVAVVIFLALYGFQHRDEVRRRWRPYAAGLGIAAGVGLVLLGYPLWVQFAGPGSYRGLPFSPGRYVSDVFSFVTYPRQALGSDSAGAVRLSQSPDEDNSNFGWALVALALVLAAWQWRRPVVRAAVGTAVVCAVLSLGPVLHIRGHVTAIPGPYALLQPIPPFTYLVPGRLAMVTVPVIGMLLALGVGMLRREPGRVRLLWIGALAGALVPLVPTPLHTLPRAEVPRFLASGEWRAYVPAGRTVVTVPLPSYQSPDPMWWQADTDLAFPMPRGYFLGPGGSDDQAIFGAPPRPTATKLYAISVLPKVPKPYVGGDTPLGATVTGSSSAATVTDADRANAVADLRYWRAAIVVLAPRKNQDKLKAAVTAMLGYPPRWVDGVWLWDVRDLAS